MPFHERTRDSSVAGRQQDQYPQARGGWEKVISYLIWPHWCITRLIRWFIGAPSPDHPIPESRSTWGTWAFSMGNLPSEAPLVRTPLRTNRYHLARVRDQNMIRESHGQPLSPPTARSLDFSSLGYVENGYFTPPTSHFDNNGPVPSSSHLSSTPAHPSQDKGTPLTAETVRWPFLSSSSEYGEESDDESGIEMEAVTSIAKLPGSLLQSSPEPSDNSDEEFHKRIGTAASTARVFINRRKALPITAGGFCEALQPHASLASGFPVENFSSDPESSLNVSSPAVDVATTVETTEDRCEGEDEVDEHQKKETRSTAVRFVK
ncbi:hypothetical protein H9Q69_010328 [Fusarium xylarioides]|nr:hypothetical protein H9Q69_010328 [Fusarium xylarioides]KAG5804449.1 hypothetical protein H9Q71_010974 [Fusarium xylarioides]KAG5810372.1 hypothetical protein H9Q74_014002 [Fusarium xylarioides]